MDKEILSFSSLGEILTFEDGDGRWWLLDDICGILEVEPSTAMSVIGNIRLDFEPNGQGVLKARAMIDSESAAMLAIAYVAAARRGADANRVS